MGGFMRLHKCATCTQLTKRTFCIDCLKKEMLKKYGNKK